MKSRKTQIRKILQMAKKKPLKIFDGDYGIYVWETNDTPTFTFRYYITVDLSNDQITAQFYLTAVGFKSKTYQGKKELLFFDSKKEAQKTMRKLKEILEEKWLERFLTIEEYTQWRNV